MAKRVAKRETNAQRRAREDERRTTRLIAGVLATIICKKGRVPLGWTMPRWDAVIHRIKQFKGKMWVAAYPKPRSKSTVRFTLLHPPPDVEDLPVKEPQSERLRETYASVGREFCEFKGNVCEFLRLVADKIEGKRSYSPGEDWYDYKISLAYMQALVQKLPSPYPSKLPSRDVPWPTFSEFLDIFGQQNPKLPKPPSERSLRRSLKRLAIITRPDKRGRPKEK